MLTDLLWDIWRLNQTLAIPTKLFGLIQEMVMEYWFVHWFAQNNIPKEMNT